MRSSFFMFNYYFRVLGVVPDVILSGVKCRMFETLQTEPCVLSRRNSRLSFPAQILRLIPQLRFNTACFTFIVSHRSE